MFTFIALSPDAKFFLGSHLDGKEGFVMTLTGKSARLRLMGRLRPATIAGIVLGLATYGMDFVMGRFGTSASRTILNDVAIGLLGALVVFFYLSASREQQNFESAKERIRLIRKLNLRIREALIVISSSAMSEDRWARLQGIDEATDRIDMILSEFKEEEETGRAAESDGLTRDCTPGSPGFPPDS